MTNEEAKEWLNKLLARADITNEYGEMEDMQPYEEAVHVANEVLEPGEELYRLITDSNSLMLLENYKTGERNVIEKRLKPCGDCISRAETQKHIYTRLYETALNNVGYKCEASDVYTNIAENRLSTWVSEIPPIPSKPETGHWIYEDECKEHGHCSECGHGSIDLVDGAPHNFCQKCGAKMKSEERK